jgi:hypothetical protein
MSEHALIETLHSLRRRVRWLSVLYGVGVVIAAMVLGVLIVITLDYLLHFPGGMRFFVLMLAIVAAVWGVVRLVVQPMLARLTLSDVAGRVEQAFPQFDDRLRSTVAFTEHEVPGSDFMKQRVIREAAELAGTVNLREAVVLKPVWHAMGAAALALAIATLLGLLDPNLINIGVQRLVSPFSSLNWPKRVQIELVGQVPERVPLGQRIDLKMRLSKGSAKKATLVYQFDDGPVQRQLMTSGDDGTFATALDARTRASDGEGVLRAWIEAGDDRREVGPITVVPRLAIRNISAVITPPAYAKRPATTADLSAGPAITSVGAQIELRATFNKPLDTKRPIELEPVGEAKIANLKTEIADAIGIARWQARESVRFRVRATDQDGFANNALEEFEIIVHPDQNPVVQIEHPRRNEERTAVAVVPLAGVAEDDYAIETMTLVVQKLGEEGQTWEIPLIADTKAVSGVRVATLESLSQRQRFRASYQWDLSKLENANLQSGDVLEYHLAVTDNFDLDGQRHSPAVSGKLRITIITQEELAERVEAEMRTLAANLDDVRNTQVRTREETEALKAETKDKPELDEADRQAAARLAQQQSAAASQAKQISGKLDELMNRLEENRSDKQEVKDTVRDARDQTAAAAEQPMREASGALAKARDQKGDPGQRQENLEKATDEQRRAEEQLDQAIERMGGVGSLAKSIDDVRKLLDEQKRLSKETQELGRRNLGKRPEEMSPEDRQKLAELSDQQKGLAKQTEEAMKSLQKAAEQMKKSDPASAQSMEQAAQTGQQQQVSQNQSKASESMKQNQQSRTQAAQKQAELGLEMMLQELKQAEKRKLEELSKKLEELSNQIRNLVRRQAGHNLDNLHQQGGEIVARLDAKLLASLLEKAERTPEKPAEIEALPALSGAQEQTERNTRDLGKSAQEVQSGAAAAAHLTRAASRMERAIVHLREKKLAAALEPPQTEALAALEEALRVVEEEKQKVDEKIEEQQREAIRRALAEIKLEQEKVNRETARIDTAPRLDGGALKREDAVRLGQLPGEQGALQDRMKEIIEALRGMGGVIYVWTGEDVGTAMGEVKDQLGQKQTGKPVQDEQTRIVAVLDMMIRNLEIKQDEQRFERPRGGGGAAAGAAGSRNCPASSS